MTPMIFGLLTTMVRAFNAARQGHDTKRVALEMGKGLERAPPVKIAQGDRSRRRCPECGDQMILCTCEGQQLDSCLTCRSYWFDVGELKAITGLFEDLPGLRFHHRPSKYTCPDCGIQMTEYVFKNPRNLLVDRCDQCKGIYLESGEIDRAIDIAKG